MTDCSPRLSPCGTYYIHADDCPSAIKINLRREKDELEVQTLGGLLEDLKEQKFDDFNDWVCNASRRLAFRNMEKKNFPYEAPSEDHQAVCVDRKGRRCYKGGCFMRARDEGAFPVHYIWPEQIKILIDAVPGVMQYAGKQEA